jgi:hypothetical protein
MGALEELMSLEEKLRALEPEVKRGIRRLIGSLDSYCKSCIKIQREEKAKPLQVDLSIEVTNMLDSLLSYEKLPPEIMEELEQIRRLHLSYRRKNCRKVLKKIAKLRERVMSYTQG